MTMFPAPSSMTTFLTHRGQATVADCFADTQQPDEPAPVCQLCVLSRLNIGVVLATQLNDLQAAREAYEHVQIEHDTVPDSLVLQLCHTACGYMADLDHNTTA